MIAYYQNKLSYSTKHTPAMYTRYSELAEEIVVWKGDKIVLELTGQTVRDILKAVRVAGQ